MLKRTEQNKKKAVSKGRHTLNFFCVFLREFKNEIYSTLTFRVYEITLPAAVQ